MCLLLALFILAVITLAFLALLVGSFFALLPWILVGLLAGWIASAITRSPHSVLGNILIGLAGSFIGGILYFLVGGQHLGGPFSLTRILAAIAGSVILLLVLNAIGGRSLRR